MRVQRYEKKAKESQDIIYGLDPDNTIPRTSAIEINNYIFQHLGVKGSLGESWMYPSLSGDVLITGW